MRSGITIRRVVVKYAQIKELSTQRLVGPGARLDEKFWTEAELISDLDLSGTPARHALDDLVREQIVEHRTGKGGDTLARRHLMAKGLRNFGVIDAPAGPQAGEARGEGLIHTHESASRMHDRRKIGSPR